MQAIMVNEYGDSEVLHPETVHDPEPGPGEVLVRIAAAGVNYMDIYQRTGAHGYASTPPFIPGAEGAGQIDLVGKDVAGFKQGDLVAWASVPGSYAELTSAPVGRLVRVPDGISAETAAAVMLQGMTAHYLVSDTYPVKPGDVVVVHAGAGGVGLLLIQLAKARGAVVVATTSSDEKASLAASVGADYCTTYEQFEDTVMSVTSGEGAAAVFDGVGKATFIQGLAVLRPRGMMALYGAASGPVASVEMTSISGKSLFLTRPSLRDHIATTEELRQRAEELFQQIREGQLTVHIGKRYPLADAARAHAELAARSTTGKLLLLPTL